MVSHAAIVGHLNRLMRVYRLDEPKALVGWVPFNHDLGLVFYLLTPLACGVPVAAIPPDSWVRRPLSLLRALHNYRDAICLMPNFGFAHIARNVRPHDLAHLDLSHVSQLIAVAEVTQAETLDDFLRLLQCTGLRADRLRVAYGMAECVLGATSTPFGVPPRIDRIDTRALSNSRAACPASNADALSVVSCGVPFPDVTITIQDEGGHPLTERRVGEIVIGSHTLFDAYINRPDLTTAALRDGRLHSGDLGYMVDGELYVVDRKKDLIISAGKNIDPEPLERVALSVLGMSAGRAAAFGVRDRRLGTELPVLVCERRGQLGAEEESALELSIRQHVRNVTDIILEDVRLVRRGWLCKTTSGKISRSATRDKYLREFPLADHAGPLIDLPDQDTLASQLAMHFGEMLGIEHTIEEDSFFDLGGDSLSILTLWIHIEETYGTNVSMEEFCALPTAANLARIIIDAKSTDTPVTPSTHAQTAARRVEPRHTAARLLAASPIIRNARSIAYGMGVRIQRSILAMPWVQRTFFQHEVDTLRRWRDLVGELDTGETIIRHLLTNTFRSWRQAMLTDVSDESPWISVVGQPALLRSVSAESGTIYLVMHTPLSRLFKRQVTNTASGILTIGLPRAAGSDTTRHLGIKVERAYQFLRQGGNVILAGDGQHGRRHISVPFFGGSAKFMLGGAELAVRSGARLVPVFASLNTDGHVTFEVGPALVSDSGSDHERAIDLTHAYAEQVIAHWPRIHSSLETWKLRQWLPRRRPHGKKSA